MSHQAEQQKPPVHVVEDNDALRDGMVDSFRLQDIPAIGYPTGEAFLAQWTPEMRGVVSLDLELRPRGQMDGDEVFYRLLALRSHQPVIFYTGPYENNVPIAVRLVKMREHVDYFGKNRPHKDFKQRVVEFLRDEPLLYERSKEERDLLQQLTIDMTHAERLALDGKLSGFSVEEYGQRCGLRPGVNALNLAAAWNRICGPKAVRVHTQRSQDEDAAHGVSSDDKVSPGEKLAKATQIVALAGKMNATGDEKTGLYRLMHLAALEFGRRLSLLDDEHQVAVHGALQGRRLSLAEQERVASALGLMSIPNVAKLKSLLKIGGEEMLGYLLQTLPEPRYRWVRHWLLWLSSRPKGHGWDMLPEPPG